MAQHTTEALPVHTFTLHLAGEDGLTPELEEAVYGSQLDDTQLGVCGCDVYLDFDREASSFEDALLTALRDLADAGLRVARVEADVVSATEIAERTGRSRQSVDQLANGDRGPGGFPSPIGSTGRTRVWRWGDVARWLDQHGFADGLDLQRPRVIELVNAELLQSTHREEARRLRLRLEEAMPAQLEPTQGFALLKQAVRVKTAPRPSPSTRRRASRAKGRRSRGLLLGPRRRWTSNGQDLP